MFQRDRSPLRSEVESRTRALARAAAWSSRVVKTRALHLIRDSLHKFWHKSKFVTVTKMTLGWPDGHGSIPTSTQESNASNAAMEPFQAATDRMPGRPSSPFIRRRPRGGYGES